MPGLVHPPLSDARVQPLQARHVAFAERTLAALLRRQAVRHGSRDLVCFGNGTLTFADAADRAARSAAALGQAGVEPGDRVALMCSNRIEFIETVLGCAWAGAVAVPINVASRGDQLEHILRNCGAKLLVAEAALAPRLAALQLAALPLRTAWIVGEAASVDLPGLSVERLPLADRGIEPHPSLPGDTATILYTSGTTGPSKGVCCPHAQYYWWGVHTAELLDIEDGDTLHTSLPLFHTNALNSFYQALITGSTLHVGARFSVSGFAATLQRTGADVTYLLGAMVPMLLSRPPSIDERAHRTRIALAPGVPAQFHAPFRERFGIGLIDGYGSTETNFVIGDRLADQVPGFMGRVRPGFDARVFDPQDEELPDGTAGELVLRADEPYAFATGYFGAPEQTLAATRNLWFHTGDRVVREPDGRFRFLDRMKDAIRRRGENISSFEVEQVVNSHPAVSHAAVFPVQSELAEDEVMVAVVLDEAAELSPRELLDFCQPRLPYFALPRFVDIVAALPKTENGKVQKFKLRESGVTDTTWDREAEGYEVLK
ncbi:ATP-dependent acyl-CoA ligase [Aureimonas ureilytica]|uniref:ATP-dependent acyl-CoA ligase n=1 Tax=Aureimonas ureilytica TaxID=401562 RepID=UPI003CF5B812